MGRSIFGADKARQQDDYGQGMALEKIAARQPEKLAPLVAEDTANTKKQNFWEKLAAAGAGVAGAAGAAMAMPAKAAEPTQSPFLSAYINSRRNALRQQIGE
jgi:hypothetical protein